MSLGGSEAKDKLEESVSAALDFFRVGMAKSTMADEVDALYGFYLSDLENVFTFDILGFVVEVGCYGICRSNSIKFLPSPRSHSNSSS